jgi:hypothetical protein
VENPLCGMKKNNSNTKENHSFKEFGIIDGSEATRISLIIRAKEFNTDFEKVHKKLYPLLSNRGKKFLKKTLNRL